MDLEFNEQEKMIRAMARDFASKTVSPQASEIDAAGKFPTEIVNEMSKLQFFGIPFPKKYGGVGASWQSYVLAIEQLSYPILFCGALIAVEALSAQPIFHFGTEEQKQKYLVPVLSGEKLSRLGFTESMTGSDPEAIVSRASRSGEEYIITGEKNFVTPAAWADVLVAFARDDTEKLSAFIIDIPCKGLEIGKPIDTLGMKGAGACPVSLNEVHVPLKNLLGEPARGYNILLEGVNVSKLGIAAAGVGLSQAALDMSLDYARQRIVYGKPLSLMSNIQYLLAEMVSRIESIRWLTYRAASLKDSAGTSFPQFSAIAKLHSAEVATDVTTMAMQIHGAYGFTTDLQIERLYRDARAIGIIEGSSEIQRTIIANNLAQN